MDTRSSHKILVVDDEIHIRHSLGAYLEDHGYRVASVESAEEAIDLIGRESFDLMLVDLRLPGISGDQLIVRACQLQPGIKCLIHTGSMDYHLSDELERIGMRKQNIFYKPVKDLKLLLDAIEAEISVHTRT